MVSKTKIAIIAAIAVVGIASPAFADGGFPAPQYSLPSEAPDFGATPSPQSRQTVVHGRALYNSAVVPTNNATDDNWAHDAEWSTTSHR
jgi:hypothetical protein